MAKAHVLLIPCPAQGHVIPAMELARRLVNNRVKVTFVNTEVIQKVVTRNWVEKDGCDDLMQMVSIPDGLEPWEDRKEHGKLMRSMKETMPSKLEELIETINKDGNDKITCLIADCWMAWSLGVAKKMGIRRATFCPASTATLAIMMSIQKFIDDGFIDKNGTPQNSGMIRLAETMPPIKPETLIWTSRRDSSSIEVHFQNCVKQFEDSKLAEWFLCNSAVELEPAAFSLFPLLLPVGPLLASSRLADQEGQFWQEDLSCLAWLDQQPVCSVIYIAFGSFTDFNQTQFIELALGLELSNRPFLWVVRPGMTKESTTSYPDGYMDRVGSRGRIVSWAPQQKVLAHPSVACFMSHCGWNSTLEGVTNGLPFLCWPYFCDQYYNESYICDTWKTGLGFDKDEAGVITREEIKEKFCKVSERVLKFGGASSFAWRWRHDPTSLDETLELTDCFNLLASVKLSEKKDSWSWHGTGSEFTVANLKAWITTNEVSNTAAIFDWCKWLPQKCNIFMWRARLERLPTKEALSKRNIHVQDNLCVFCEDRAETARHIFTGCIFSNVLWQAIARWCRLPVFYVCDLQDLTSIYKSMRVNATTKNMVHGLVIIGCWRIWKARNDCIFNNKNTKIDEVISGVKAYGFLWYINRSTNVKCTWDEWCNCDML